MDSDIFDDPHLSSARPSVHVRYLFTYQVGEVLQRIGPPPSSNHCPDGGEGGVERIAWTLDALTPSSAGAPVAEGTSPIGVVIIAGTRRSHATRVPCLEELDLGEVGSAWLV